MNNFEVEVDGNKYWISRSVATVVYCYTKIGGIYHVLANKRGSGVDKSGLWNCVQGFLNFDEKLEECACRELHEETGVNIKPTDLKLYEIDSNPERTNQTVLVNYFCYIRPNHVNELTTEFSEPNEVDEVKWIPIHEVKNYEWVSERHKNLIKQIWIYEINKGEL